MAELSAQTTLTTQQMQAATQAAGDESENISKPTKKIGKAISKTVDPMVDDKTEQMQASLQAMQDQNAAIMEKMTMALEAMSKPKTLTMQAPSGNTYTGTVN